MNAHEPSIADFSSEVARHAFIVIAAFNEEGSVGKVVAELLPRYPNVVVVDDGSRDGTADEAHAAGAHVARHVINRGQGAALQTGIRYALKQGAKYVVTFDADGQHDPDEIESMLRPIAEGEVDICLGSRFLEHADAVPLIRRTMLRGAIIFTRLTSGMKLTDAHNGFRALSRQAASKLDIQLDRMAHASEIIDQIRKTGLPYKEIPVHIRYTEYSLAKGQRSTQAFRVALDYLIGRVLR